MILKTEKFIKGAWGRMLLYSLMLSILYTGYGCTRYHQVSMAKTEFMTNEQIQNSIGDYHLYVHDGASSYRLQEVKVVDQKEISGKLIPAAYEEFNPDWKRHERKMWWNDHKYDVHVYTNESVNSTASLDAMPSVLGEQVVLSDNMIKDIQVVAHDRKSEVGAAVVVLVVIVGAAIVVLLTIVAIGASDNNNGGGSDSGSDSGDSGDSDSGDSNSGGGSDSGSSD